MPVELTKNYLSIRVRNPNAFKRSSFRTDDIGRKNHSLRIAGILRKSGQYATQAWRIKKSDLKKGDRRALLLLDRVSRDLPKRDRMQLVKKLAEIK